MNRALLLAAMTLPLCGALSGCGLHPLYGGGAHGTVQSTLAAIEVAPIEGKSGWLIGKALKDRLAEDGSSAPKYRLQVKLDNSIIGLGVQADDSISRERVTLRARYQLVDLSTGEVLLDATAGSDAGLDVVGSEYATIAAEESALERLTDIVADQIVMRVGRYIRSDMAGHK